MGSFPTVNTIKSSRITMRNSPGLTRDTFRASESIPQATFILSMTAGLILFVIDIKLKNPHIAITVIAGLLFTVGLVGCCYVKIADVIRGDCDITVMETCVS
ncbi:uncharacterized protein TNIN_95801 [Trichonephila inaurata madagascariensis]|uniref:Uncharacterized protein n=1 Tax=Trichonephila inaurata madagascariensis TaxID=2747483 RepID=A0A8X7BXI2_9ARAC|nr:uncharacterized protein TNIN_95801 [Trichonephila inaurata madagascariensis]